MALWLSMEITEILKRFERPLAKFPKEAVAEAVGRREEITPWLLAILEETAGRPEGRDARLDHLFAMYLLAQFREVRAYPLYLKIASLPGDTLESLLGEVVTSSLGRMLACVCGGDLAGIKVLIEDVAVDEWCRGAALDSLVTLVVSGEKSREEIVAYFGELLRGKLKREGSVAWDSLARCVCDLYPLELRDDIKTAYGEGLIDKGFVSPKDFIQTLGEGQAKTLEKMAGNSDYALIGSAAGEMGSWAYDREAGETEKVGRNDPCPCGSGKKFKKCHGA